MTTPTITDERTHDQSQLVSLILASLALLGLLLMGTSGFLSVLLGSGLVLDGTATLILNLGTELAGAAVMFWLLFLLSRRKNPLPIFLSAALISVLLVALGLAIPVLAYRQTPSGGPWRAYFSDLTLNLSTEMIGALIVFAVLDNVLDTLKSDRGN